jgi:RimJ/RimL family protein N-acetyltransferase
MNKYTRMLESTNVYLRPVEKEDMELIYKALQNPEVRRLTGSKRVFTRPQLDQYFERISSDSSRVDFTICLKENNEPIGDIALMDISQSNRSAVTRIAINEEVHYGKGYGTEAMKLMLDFAFGVLNLHRVQLDVYSYNERAIKSYEKAGFKVEGRIRDELYYNHAYHDSIIMGILEDEYRMLDINR